MPILALLAVLALGSGAFAHLHRQQHEAEDARPHRHDDHHHHHHDGDDETPPAHDETNCHLHAMLRAPLMSGAWTPVLVGLGVFVAFLSMLPRGIEGRLALARIDCRGPPAR